jgi:hypothetical protein
VRTWYLCMALMSMTKKAISAHEMRRQLGMKRYEPVWAMMHKIILPGSNEEPKKFLIEKYSKKNGKAKKLNYEVCEACNNLIASLSGTKSVLTKSILKAEQAESLRTFRLDVESYLQSKYLHPVEGIWSVDATTPDGSQVKQHFEVAIHRYGKGFIIQPLTLDFPEYDNSSKYFEATQEPSIFLLTAQFPRSGYESKGRFRMLSNAMAEYSSP